MKLNNIQNKISTSISIPIRFKCSDKTNSLISYNIKEEMVDKIWIPNEESIEDMQRMIINKLKNEIN